MTDSSQVRNGGLPRHGRGASADGGEEEIYHLAFSSYQVPLLNCVGTTQLIYAQYQWGEFELPRVVCTDWPRRKFRIELMKRFHAAHAYLELTQPVSSDSLEFRAVSLHP